MENKISENVWRNLINCHLSYFENDFRSRKNTYDKNLFLKWELRKWPLGLPNTTLFAKVLAKSLVIISLMFSISYYIAASYLFFCTNSIHEKFYLLTDTKRRDHP
jgi:hypothetical protein